MHECRRHRLDERCGTTDEGERTCLWKPGDLPEHLLIYAAAIPHPAGGLGTGECVGHLQRPILRREAFELPGVDRIFARARGVEEAGRCVAPGAVR